MSGAGVTLVHLGDIHFGPHVELAQIAALERLLPELAPSAVVFSGDLTQRARHGEFQRALVLVQTVQRTAPTLVVPGNHDTTWWRTPFELMGKEPKHRKYRRYFGPELGPVLQVPGAVIVGTLSAHGLAWGSVTWNPRDLTVKGHLPRAETERAAGHFTRADPGDLRVLVLHHNVLRGELSGRMGLAHWRDAQRRLDACGADLVLCGHDHQEQVGQLEGGTVVACSNTLTDMTRGQRPSVFNLITADSAELRIRYLGWDGRAFVPGAEARYARRSPRAAPATS